MYNYLLVIQRESVELQYCCLFLLLVQPENLRVVKPESGEAVLKLLHFSRAQEVLEGAATVVPPLLDHMEFEGV